MAYNEQYLPGRYGLNSAANVNPAGITNQVEGHGIPVENVRAPDHNLTSDVITAQWSTQITSDGSGNFACYVTPFLADPILAKVGTVTQAVPPNLSALQTKYSMVRIIGVSANVVPDMTYDTVTGQMLGATILPSPTPTTTRAAGFDTYAECESIATSVKSPASVGIGVTVPRIKTAHVSLSYDEDKVPAWVARYTKWNTDPDEFISSAITGDLDMKYSSSDGTDTSGVKLYELGAWSVIIGRGLPTSTTFAYMNVTIMFEGLTNTQSDPGVQNMTAPAISRGDRHSDISDISSLFTTIGHHAAPVVVPLVNQIIDGVASKVPAVGPVLQSGWNALKGIVGQLGPQMPGIISGISSVMPGDPNDGGSGPDGLIGGLLHAGHKLLSGLLDF